MLVFFIEDRQSQKGVDGRCFRFDAACVIGDRFGLVAIEITGRSQMKKGLGVVPRPFFVEHNYVMQASTPWNSITSITGV